MRRPIVVFVVLLVAVAVYFSWQRFDASRLQRATNSATAARDRTPAVDAGAPASLPQAKSLRGGGTPPGLPGAAPLLTEADFPIAVALNASGATIMQDLDIVQQLLDAWRSNFPHEGNPVGENADITAALLGDNRLGLALLPKGHRALNGNGELCDRWGTPFRFHQISGTKMEVRSAGPDRKFATPDDALWTPQ